MESVPAAENFSLQYITERLAATAELPANMLAVKVKSFLDPLDELQDYEDFFAINPRKPWQEVHLAIWLKNSLFFEMSSQSGFCQLVNNAG